MHQYTENSVLGECRSVYTPLPSVAFAKSYPLSRAEMHDRRCCSEKKITLLCAIWRSNRSLCSRVKSALYDTNTGASSALRVASLFASCRRIRAGRLLLRILSIDVLDQIIDVAHVYARLLLGTCSNPIG